LHFVTPVSLPIEVTSTTYDVVHLHEVRTLLNYLVLLKVDSRQFVFSPWGTLPANSRFRFIKKTMDLFLQPLLRKKIETAFAQTSHEEKVLKELNIGQKQIIVPLGIDVDYFKIVPSLISSRRKLSLDKRYCFLFLGRFSPVKGIDVLLKACSILHRRNISFQVLLIGRDDGYLHEIENLLKENDLLDIVKVCGPLYERERLLAYSASDCFISVPTVYEETSTTCLEALMCRKPIITSIYSEIPFMREKDGVTHTSSNPVEISEVMIKHIFEKPHVNMDKVKKLFDWKKSSELMERYYE